MKIEELVQIMRDGFQRDKTYEQIAREILDQVLAAYGIK